MVKRTDGTFYKDYVIPKDVNELKMGIANSERSTYEIIARYHVE